MPTTFDDLIRSRGQTLDDLRRSAQVESGVLDEATKQGQLERDQAMAALMQSVMDQQSGPMMPVGPSIPPLMQGLMSLSGNVGSNISGNPDFRNRANATLDQNEAQRDQAIQANVGLSRDDLKTKQQQLLSLGIERYSKLAEHFSTLDAIKAANYTKEAQKQAAALKDMQDLENTAAKSTSDADSAREIANIRAATDRYTADRAAQARAFGVKDARMSETDYRKWKNDVIKENSNSKGDIVNMPSFRGQLAWGVNASHNLETWLQELASTRVKSFGGDKPVFPITIMRNAEGKVIGVSSTDKSVERLIKSVVEANFADEIVAPEEAAPPPPPGDGEADPGDDAELDLQDAQARLGILTDLQKQGYKVSEKDWAEARKTVQDAARKIQKPKLGFTTTPATSTRTQ